MTPPVPCWSSPVGLRRVEDTTARSSCSASHSRSFRTWNFASSTSRWRWLTARSEVISARTGLVHPSRTTPGPIEMRKRPDSASTPRRPGPRAHGAAGSNSAAAAVTISGLGNRRPNASIARSSPVAIPSSSVSRTFSAHITSPPAMAGLRPAPRSTSGRPLPLSRPAAWAASGARDLPSTEAPAEPCREDGCCDADVESRVEGVGTAADDAMLGIGVPAPRSPRSRVQRRRKRRSS